MSYLPVGWAAFESRDSGDKPDRIPPKVLSKGSEKAVIRLMPEFRARYIDTIRLMGSSIIEQQRFDYDIGLNGHMTVISNHNQDIIYLEAYEEDVQEDKNSPFEGFLVTLADGTQRLYDFDFDKSMFGYSNEQYLNAGNRRVYVDDDVYISWDGTGGGDIAPEHETNEFRPNYQASPFSALSGSLYSQGEKYPFVEGKILGVGADGSRIVVAVWAYDGLSFHEGAVEYDDNDVVSDIYYVSPLGYASGPGQHVVNFNSNLSKAVCGEHIIDIPLHSSGSNAALSVTVILPEDGEIVRSGFDSLDNIHFTLKVVGETGSNQTFCPKNPFEYGLALMPDSSPITTTSSTGETYTYYDVAYSQAWELPETPEFEGTQKRLIQCVVMKKPTIIMHNATYPELAFAWMRTVHNETIETDNRYYWYRDYKTDEYVRYHWGRNYLLYWDFNEYGSAADPVLTDVVHSYTLNVNAQKLISGTGNALWFYTCADGIGDFILRKAPNGSIGQAMLISKSGSMRTVDDVVRVDII